MENNSYFCTILLFTLTWIFCVTYIVASTSFRKMTYITFDMEQEAYIDDMVKMTCWITTFSTVIGGLLMKIGATHGIWVLFISILNGMVVPGLSLYNLIQLKNIPEIIDWNIIATVIDFWKDHGELPAWMEAVQRDIGCCGLNNFADYRSYIYSRVNNSKARHCYEEDYDVPASCLNLDYLFDACNEYEMNSYCSAYVFMMDSFVFENDTLNEEMSNLTRKEKNIFKCDVMANGGEATRLITKGVKNTTVWNEGCIGVIVDNMESLHQSHYMVSFILIFISFAILMIFLTFWLDVAHAKSRNNHN